MLPQAGLLIGCGSVGKKHALAMALRYNFLVIVDKDESVSQWASSNIKVNYQIYTDIEDSLISELCKNYTITAVIATWGPTHSEIFNVLVQNGVRRIVCEKPFSNSLSSAGEMILQAKVNNARVVVGVTRRYTKLAESLNQILGEYCGGAPEAIVVSGGAQCVATMGVHWLDLAFQLFKSNAVSVLGNLRSDNINPRDETLGYWEGSAIWEFPNKKFFTINFTNSSRVAAHVEIIGKLGTVTIEPSGDIVVRRIELSVNEEDLPITRTKQALVLKIIEDKDQVIQIEPFLEQLDVVDGSMELPYPLDEVENVLNALIGAFESSLTESKVFLPIKKNEAGYSRVWNIS